MSAFEGLKRVAWAIRSSRSLSYARSKGAPGTDFGVLGRSMGWRLLLGGAGWGLNWLVNPVSVVRYFEFDFARRCLEGCEGAAADLASPRLFSFAESLGGRLKIRMINPDATDLQRSQDAARRLGLQGLEFDCAGAELLKEIPGTLDAVFSLSVLEHIDGPYDEREVLRWAWEALKPGGRLVLSVPVGRKFQVETRPGDPYGTQKPMEGGGFFFQRIYDQAALEERILGTLGVAAEKAEYFGETSAGTYAAYEARWLEWGMGETADDPRLIADHFAFFPDWASMPGLGVVGMQFTKH